MHRRSAGGCYDGAIFDGNGTSRGDSGPRNYGKREVWVLILISDDDIDWVGAVNTFPHGVHANSY